MSKLVDINGAKVDPDAVVLIVPRGKRCDVFIAHVPKAIDVEMTADECAEALGLWESPERREERVHKAILLGLGGRGVVGEMLRRRTTVAQDPVPEREPCPDAGGTGGYR